MLRIAIWYEGATLGRNDGNPLYLTALFKRVQFFHDRMEGKPENGKLLNYFPIPNNIPNVDADVLTKAFAEELYEKYGRVEIEHIRPFGDNLHIYGDFDINLWIDWGEDGLKGVLPYDSIFPKHNMVYWASDTHLGYDYRLETAKKASVVFVAQKKAVDDFKRDGVDATWLPHAFEPLAYPRRIIASKKYDIAFVGHVNSENRMDALDRLFREFPNFYYGQRRMEEAAEKFNQSRLVYNICMKDDLNMRVFEALGSGNCLLTDAQSDIETFFEDGKDLVLYRSLDEMVDKAKYYLAHDELRQQIAESGYKKALANHTFIHRARLMLEHATQTIGV